MIGNLGLLVLMMLLCNGANLTLGLTSSTLARAARVAYLRFCEVFHNISRPDMIVLSHSNTPTPRWRAQWERLDKAGVQRHMPRRRLVLIGSSIFRPKGPRTRNTEHLSRECEIAGSRDGSQQQHFTGG